MGYSEYIKELKARYISDGISGLSKSELADLIVSFGSPRVDLRDRTKELTDGGEDPCAVFRTSRRVLENEYGFSSSAALFPSVILAAVSRAMSETDKKAVISDDASLGQLLIYKYLGRDVETVYLTLLDSERRLIDMVLLNEGSVSDAMVSPRKLLEHSITRRAKYAALSHNHPGGEAIPSDTDKYTTELILQTFSYTDIEFIGHYVVAGKEYTIIK